MSKPAKNGALDPEETLKLKTSFQAYGSMLVKAIGSATRTSAALNCKCVGVSAVNVVTYQAGKAEQRERHHR